MLKPPIPHYAAQGRAAVSAGLSQRQENLLAALEGAVPLRIVEMRNWPFEKRRDSLDIEAITNTADVLQYGSGPKRTAAERKASVRAFNALVGGLAVGAYQPGGVTFAGRHWCVEPHCLCPNRLGAVCATACREDCPIRVGAPC